MHRRILLKTWDANRSPIARACFAEEFPDPMPEASLKQKYWEKIQVRWPIYSDRHTPILGLEAVRPTHGLDLMFQVARHLRGSGSWWFWKGDIAVQYQNSQAQNVTDIPFFFHTWSCLRLWPFGTIASPFESETKCFFFGESETHEKYCDSG